MCKQPARYYCHKCGVYFTDPGDLAHAPDNTPFCPTCRGPVVEAPRPDSDHTLFCPRCELPVQAFDAIPPDGAKGVSCSHCGTELVEPPDPADNPVSFPIALKVVGVVARLLLKSGAIENLEQYAATTDNRLDDLAARIAGAMLRECARL